MEHSRKLLFNLKNNDLLQLQLIKKDVSGKQFVAMTYTQLASQKMANQRKLHEKERLEKMNGMIADNNDWIECTVKCTNCGATKCKYKTKKVLFESTKSAVFGSASSK